MSTRSLKINIINSTKETFTLDDDNTYIKHAHWGSGASPASSIPSGGSSSPEAYNTTGQTIGFNGLITYTGTDGNSFTVTFDKPFSSGATIITPSCAGSLYSFTKVGDGGGHDGSTTITFSNK
jgi:hypothetical protein